MCYFMNLPYLVHSWPDISTEKNPPQEQKTTDQPQNMASSQERFKVKPVSTSLIEILRVTFHNKKSHYFLNCPRIYKTMCKCNTKTYF